MRRNVFIKKNIIKSPNTSEDKFNPDVLNNYDKFIETRENTSFNNKNTPYKIIIEDNIPQKVTSGDDLIINTEQKIDINTNYIKLMESRNYLDDYNKNVFTKSNFEDNKGKFLNRRNTVQLMSQKTEDFGKLKKDRTHYYQKEQKTLDNEKQRYNSILNSLKEKGLINS